MPITYLSYFIDVTEFKYIKNLSNNNKLFPFWDVFYETYVSDFNLG